MAAEDQAKIAYETFRAGFNGSDCPVPLWEDAPSWVRDVALVAYQQGWLDGREKPPLNGNDRFGNHYSCY